MESSQRDAGGLVGIGSGTGTLTFLGAGSLNSLRQELCSTKETGEKELWRYLLRVPAGYWTLVTVW